MEVSERVGDNYKALISMTYPPYWSVEPGLGRIVDKDSRIADAVAVAVAVAIEFVAMAAVGRDCTIHAAGLDAALGRWIIAQPAK